MRSLGDAHLLTGALLPATDYKQKIYHLEEALKCFLSQDNFSAASVMYRNISSLYSKQGYTQKAQAYNDLQQLVSPCFYQTKPSISGRNGLVSLSKEKIMILLCTIIKNMQTANWSWL